MATDQAFDLLPAGRADIPRLAWIHVIACESDNCFKLYFDSHKEFEQRVADMLDGQIGNPTWKHIKAVNTKTGQIAAWASWVAPTDEQILERDAKAAADTHTEQYKVSKGEFDMPPGLPQIVQVDTQKWLNRSTQGRRHILCKALFTDPAFQRRGMGNALIVYGNRLADEAGLPILLQASPFGFPVYEKNGFETVQHLDVDLREWAPRAKDNDKGYGNYRFRYMLRLPRTLPATASS